VKKFTGLRDIEDAGRYDHAARMVEIRAAVEKTM
jgi:hypothetical protein